MGLLAPKRGEVYLVAFDSSVGSGINKTRPAVIVQNDIYNQHGAVTIVAAITSFRMSSKRFVTKVYVEAPEGGLDNDSIIVLNQLRTVDKQRLQKKIGALSPETVEKVDNALRVSRGLVR